MTLKTARR